MKYFVFVLVIAILCPSCDPEKEQVVSLCDDAAWCWFSDPRAIVSGDSLIFSGGVSEDGSIVAFSYNDDGQHVQNGIIHKELETDDHNNPAFLETSDGHILAFYTRHHNDDMYVARSEYPADITEWENPRRIDPRNDEEIKKYGEPRYTYANPFMLSSENNRIYLFGRWTGFKPTMCWSDDQGETWSDSHVVISSEPFDPGNRPYVKYFSDDGNRIHMIFTDGHPRVEPTNSVYYAYYESEEFFRADGSRICSLEDLPFAPGDASLVYDAGITGDRAWVYDIKATEEGWPVIAYARYPEETDHIYHYARYEGESWDDQKICHSGSWFPDTPEGEKEREPHYSGGLTIDPGNESFVFLSRNQDGVFEIEKWKINDDGSSELVGNVTGDSQDDNVRPVALSGNDLSAVLWMTNQRYVHYTDYSSAVKIQKTRIE